MSPVREGRGEDDGEDMDMMNHDALLETSPLNNLPVGMSAMDELPPAPVLHPDRILEESKGEDILLSEMGAASRSQHSSVLQERPKATLPHPLRASSTPRLRHQGTSCHEGKDPRLQIPPSLQGRVWAAAGTTGLSTATETMMVPTHLTSVRPPSIPRVGQLDTQKSQWQ